MGLTFGARSALDVIKHHLVALPSVLATAHCIHFQLHQGCNNDGPSAPDFTIDTQDKLDHMDACLACNPDFTKFTRPGTAATTTHASTTGSKLTYTLAGDSSPVTPLTARAPATRIDYSYFLLSAPSLGSRLLGSF